MRDTLTGRQVVHVTSVHDVRDVRIFEKECRCLARAGAAVTLIGPGEGRHVRDGIQVIGVGSARSRLERMTRLARRAVRQARAESGDVYHLHDPELLLWWPVYGGTGKVVFDLHEDLARQLFYKPWLPNWFAWIAGGVARGVLEVTLPLYEVILAEDSYRDSYHATRRATIVRNYPRFSDLQEIGTHRVEGSGDELTVAYVGDLTPERGLFIILDALEELQSAGHDVRWLCVGPMEDEVARQIRAYLDGSVLRDRVEFFGRLEHRSALDVVSAADIGLCVLKDVENYRRSLPTKLLEYMGLGLPVIASNFPLYRAIVEDAKCGTVVPPDDPSKLAEAILELGADRDRMRALGTNGRRSVRTRYRWREECRRMLSVYRGLLAGTPQRNYRGAVPATRSARDGS